MRISLFLRRCYVPMKNPLKIKLVIAFLMATFLQVNGKVYSQKITLSLKNAKLEDVFKQIMNQTGYQFVYYSQVLRDVKPIDIEITNASLNEALDKCFIGQPLTYIVKDKTVIIQLKERKPQPVKGKVSDEKGEPLPGVSVVIKGVFGKGTSTDSNGNYSLEVDEMETVLIFSFIGFQTMEIEIGGRSIVDVGMFADIKTLDEVVLVSTGFQQISKERSAGSYALIKGETVQANANMRGNFLESLEGKAPGFNVNYSANADKFLIRGVTSVNSTRSPLYVVDGVPITETMIQSMVNSNDIESVTILKDATATSIWGSRAANGVVVITTKKGKSGKINVSFNTSFTYRGKPNYSYLDRMDSKTFIRSAEEVFNPNAYPWDQVSTSTISPVLPHEIPMYKYYQGEISKEERDNELNALEAQNGRKQYEKFFMSNAFLQNQSLSVSGGSEKQTFYVSFDWQKDQGTEKNQSNQYQLYAKENINVAKWFKLDLGLNVSVGTTKSHLFSYSWDELNDVNITDLPYAVPYDNAGNAISYTQYKYNKSVQDQSEALSGINLDWYPVKDFNGTTNNLISRNIRANAGLEINIFRGLKYEGRFQYSTSNANTETYSPSETFQVRLDRVFATSNDGTAYLPSTGGYFAALDGNTEAYTIRNQLSYDNSFGYNSKHQVTAIVGAGVDQAKDDSNSKSLRGYEKQTMMASPYDEYLLKTSGVADPILLRTASGDANYFEQNQYLQTGTLNRFVSLYSNAAYTYNHKYSLNGSIRVDQSNLFGSDPSVQFKPIYSVGALWRLGEESIMKDVNFINGLSLRSSYGFAGNSPISGTGGPYNIISSVTDPVYSKYGLGYTVSSPANNKLSWERTRTWNIGIDFSMFNQRLSGSLDVYDKKTEDLLAPIKIDATTGYGSVISNVGILSNKGFETMIESHNIVGDKLNWYSSLVMSYNKNELVDMYVEPLSSPYMQVTQVYSEHRPVGNLYAYDWAGLDGSDGAPRVFNSKGEIVRSVADVDLSAIKYKGTTIPPWSGSITNTFRYKNVEMSFMFIGNLGSKLRNDLNTTFTYRLSSNLHNDFDKRWRQPGDENHTNVPSYFNEYNSSVNETDYLYLYKYANINVLDASYIKLRNLSLSYYMPENMCSAIKAANVKLTIQATNLWMIAFNGQGIDPEAFDLTTGGRTARLRPTFSGNLSVNF